MGFHVACVGYRGIMPQPAITEYTVEVHDLGHIPPYDSKPRWNRRLLQRHGWRETNERPEGFTDTRRLFWYQHGDVLLVVDDTSLLAVIIPSHARRRDTRTIRPTVESLMDWKKSSGRKRLVELKQASHRTVIACRGVDLTRIIADMVSEMLAEQNELLGAVIYQHPIRYRGWQDLLLQRARITRCHTSMLVDRHDSQWRDLDKQLDAYATYLDACYLGSDRMSRIAGLILSDIFSSAGIVSLFLTKQWPLWIMVFFLIACSSLFLFSLPRK